MSSNLITITRKIQLLFNTSKKSELSAHYKTIRRWQYIVFKASNLVSTHRFVQENIKDLLYLQDETKVKLSNGAIDEEGILTTSRQNSTYQLLSKHFKGEIPTGILTALNSVIVQTFNKEKKDYTNGTRSLRSYRSDIPVPIGAASILNMKPVEESGSTIKLPDYSFTLYGLPFRTNFGRDLSGNRIIWDRVIQGDYKLCDSSIVIKDSKIFLLATIRFEKEQYTPDPDCIAECWLDIDTPIVVRIKDKEYKIGSKEEFLYRRIALQGAVRRLQQQAKYNKGGQGTKRKLQALDKVKSAEKSYVDYKTHQYSAMLLRQAIKFKVGVIVLINQQKKETEAKEQESGFLLRNWSYHQLKQKIEYKASKYGITLVEEEVKTAIIK